MVLSYLCGMAAISRLRRVLAGAAAAVLMLLAQACSDDSQFRVHGTVEGNPSMNLRVCYYADYAYRTLVTAVRDGEFEFTGRASQPAMVEIFDHEYRLLGRVFVANGEEIECHLERGNPLAATVKGNPVAEQWADFQRKNIDALKGGREKANAVIADYVGKNPGSVVSALLIVTSLDASADPALADSLVSLLEPQARPAGLVDGYNYLIQRLVTDRALGVIDSIPYHDSRDSLRTFLPSAAKASVLVFSDDRTPRADSIVPELKRLSEKYSRKRLSILDFTFAGDTLTWKRTIEPDTASWTQAWAPGWTSSPGIEQLGVPDLPYFIVCDSTGVQIYRGASVSVAAKEAEKLLKK